MGRKLFIANWKSHKTTPEASKWLQEFQISSTSWADQIDSEVVICPSFTLLSTLKELITQYQLPIKLGAQDISPFDEGAYTGEVTGRQIKEFANYVLIGHSERRQHFGETDAIVFQKIREAQKRDLTPILCVSNIGQLPTTNYELITNNYIVAYEPLSAIGTGIADSPEDAENQAKKIKSKVGDITVLYGGSVNPANVKSFTSLSNINGVLVGEACLDSEEFLKIIHNA